MSDELKPKNTKNLPKWLRIIIIVFASLILLNIIIGAGIAWYIKAHKQELLKKIATSVSNKLEGNFHIDDMKPALFRGFPNAAVELEGITLSDSLYKVYHINLVEIKNVYIKLDVFSLLTHPEIIKVTLSDGAFHMFNAPNGYSNDYLLHGKPDKESTGNNKKNKKIDFENFGIENFTVNIEDKSKQKQILLLIKEMNGNIHSVDTAMEIRANSNIYVNGLGFDLAKGSYLGNKDLQANFHLFFNKEKKDLRMPVQPVKINDNTLMIGADFNFGTNPKTYALDISAPAIGFREAASIVPQNLQQTLHPFNLKNKFALKVTVIDGHLNGPDDPIVHATWQVKDNDFTVPFGVMQNASFNGSYYNNVIPGQPHKDPNSQLSLDTLTASFYNIPVKMWDVRMFNLTHPVMDFKFVSDFNVNLLNNIFGNTFNFKNGSAKIDMAYHGGIEEEDTAGHSLIGKIHLADVAFTYVPANFNFLKGNVDLLFNKENLTISNAALTTQKSDITLNGIANNFMNLYFTNPDKIIFDWNIHSNKLVFDEFTGLLNSNSPHSKNDAHSSSNKSLQNINTKLLYTMKNSKANLHLHVVDILYRTFSAQSLEANASLSPSDIALNNAAVNFAGGTIQANISVKPNGNAIPFQMQTNVNDVEVNNLFKAFGNFGQTSITDQNLNGTFSAKANVTGTLNTQANLMKNSLNGNIFFQLINGSLINYKPLLSIQKYIFKKRDMANVSFKTIKNNFTINNGKITVPPMTIASNVIEMSLQGIYGINGGTDLSIDVPLRNPEKTAQRKAEGKKVHQGIVVHLRAKDDGSGNAKLVWNPFNKKSEDKEDDNGDDAE
ncbi:MAG: AsmA-like C-terminal region-containing protein [Arachidicoccus sp.]|nr:AsmA-like C-terminal region-containing protein [Arachidicoccus sp.]